LKIGPLAAALDRYTCKWSPIPNPAQCTVTLLTWPKLLPFNQTPIANYMETKICKHLIFCHLKLAPTSRHITLPTLLPAICLSETELHWPLRTTYANCLPDIANNWTVTRLASFQACRTYARNVEWQHTVAHLFDCPNIQLI